MFSQKRGTGVKVRVVTEVNMQRNQFLPLFHGQNQPKDGLSRLATDVQSPAVHQEPQGRILCTVILDISRVFTCFSWVLHTVLHRYTVKWRICHFLSSCLAELSNPSKCRLLIHLIYHRKKKKNKNLFYFISIYWNFWKRFMFIKNTTIFVDKFKEWIKKNGKMCRWHLLESVNGKRQLVLPLLDCLSSELLSIGPMSSLHLVLFNFIFFFFQKDVYLRFHENDLHKQQTLEEECRCCVLQNYMKE